MDPFRLGLRDSEISLLELIWVTFCGTQGTAERQSLYLHPRVAIRIPGSEIFPRRGVPGPLLKMNAPSSTNSAWPVGAKMDVVVMLGDSLFF